MKKLIPVLLLCGLFTLGAFSQQIVSISGKLKMKPGTTIRFSHFPDQISSERERLSTVKTGADSSFTTSFQLSSAGMVNISVNELGLEALFYPGRHYAFDLVSSGDEHVGNLLMITADPSTNPQTLLNDAYRVFTDSTLSLLFRQNNQRAAKSDAERFNLAIDKALKQVKDSFCVNLIQSKRIDYLTMSRAVNFPTAFNQYLDCNHLPLSNPAFQSLLYSNFRLYFTLGPPQVTRLNLSKGIPDSLHFSNLLKILAVDPSLNCLALRENVLLENINSMITDGILPPEKGISLFKEGAVSVTNPFNRQVAEHLINNLSHELSANPVPDFTLLYPDGSSHSLSSFKGKPLHISFFTLKGMADRTLLDQIAIVEHVSDSLGLANFICITTDPGQEAVKKYWMEKKYPMQLCFAPDDYELIDYFKAYAFPSFALLDSKGRIFSQSPSFPGDQLLKQLNSLSQSENPKKTEPKTKAIPQQRQDSQYLPGSPRRYPFQATKK